MKTLYQFTFIALIFFSCKKPVEVTQDNLPQYDIILVAGQSNTLNGVGLDPDIDLVSDSIEQLGRWDGYNYQIIPAIEPLDHHDKRKGRIGFALTFAKLYKNKYLQAGRKLILIACGKGSTGFKGNSWNQGDPLYTDAVERINHICSKYPGSKMVTLLWHQGEHDVDNELYYLQLDQMVMAFRNDVSNWQEPKIFIAGGLVPFWTSALSSRKKCNLIIKNLCYRVPYTGYADPEKPYVILKDDNTIDSIHYDAKGLREMGRRYFNVYEDLTQ